MNILKFIHFIANSDILKKSNKYKNKVFLKIHEYNGNIYIRFITFQYEYKKEI